MYSYLFCLGDIFGVWCAGMVLLAWIQVGELSVRTVVRVLQPPTPPWPPSAALAAASPHVKSTMRAASQDTGLGVECLVGL
jgi:hypothetical protein